MRAVSNYGTAMSPPDRETSRYIACNSSAEISPVRTATMRQPLPKTQRMEADVPRLRGAILLAALALLIAPRLVRDAYAITAPPKFTTAERYASLVVDADSGRVLAATNADHTLHPASLTKIMTLYMTFEALKRDAIDLKQPLPVSAHAASMTPTELGLRAGDKITDRPPSSGPIGMLV
jgi:D-alanyl-D-alanine carboxypeptidase